MRRLTDKIRTAIKILLKNPFKLILPAGQNGFLNFIPNSIYLKLVFRSELGYYLDLKNPQTFSEKLQWLKLFDRNPNYTKMADKFAVRSYISDKFGFEYLIPLIGVYKNVKDIPWDILPERFVIKCSHGSGCNIICRDKSKLNISDSCRKLQKWMKCNYYWSGREWPYKNIKPSIIVEQYMTDCANSTGANTGSDLTDYKFYCFGGTPKYCQVIADRSIDESIDFYDMEWKHMVFTGMHNPGEPFAHAKWQHPRPEKFYQMIEFAKKLSAGTAFVRIDFYEADGKVYFGEFTLYPKSGFGVFEPAEWNITIGKMINLPRASEFSN